MTTPKPAAKAPDPPVELLILGFLAGLGILGGVILIVVGVLNGNGGYFEGPNLNDIATKITMVSIGSTVASAGFLALLAALLLSGVRKSLEQNRP